MRTTPAPPRRAAPFFRTQPCRFHETHPHPGGRAARLRLVRPHWAGRHAAVAVPRVPGVRPAVRQGAAGRVRAGAGVGAGLAGAALSIALHLRITLRVLSFLSIATLARNGLPSSSSVSCGARTPTALQSAANSACPIFCAVSLVCCKLNQTKSFRPAWFCCASPSTSKSNGHRSARPSGSHHGSSA